MNNKDKTKNKDSIRATVESDNRFTLDRRQALFLGLAGAGGAAFLSSPWGAGSRIARAESPSLRLWRDPLPKPRAFRPRNNGRYVVGMRQFKHEIHSDIGRKTVVWGYGDRDGYSFPGPSFDVSTGQVTSVRWRNRLARDPMQPHYLPQDDAVWDTIHGAENNRKAVVHLHGGHVAANVDGYPEDTFLPGQNARYDYNIDQQAATLWYHDHALGNTRLNVMMGLAGFFLVRDDHERNMIINKEIPSSEYEMPLVFMDRRLKDDGRLGYDTAFDDTFFGDTSLVNGKAWPYMEVEPRKYRFRMLNGANTRTYTFKLADGSPVMHQIGSDGGFLTAPVELNELTLTPGERADVVIDFAQTGVNVNDDLILYNTRKSRPDEEKDEYPITDVLQFRVRKGGGDDVTLPTQLNTIVRLREEDAVQTRDFHLDDHFDSRVGDSEWQINGLGWNDITDIVQHGTTEVWNWVNNSGHVHPMHIHLVQFQVLSRTSRDGVDIGVAENEMGWKDTVFVGPKENVKVIARFDGQRTDLTDELFAYHCHVLEHEDHEMMRQYKLVY